MSRIRGRNTKPEKFLRSALWHAGVCGYRKHARTPVGRPDLVFPGPRVAVFVDGCFWHGCPLHYVRPRTRCEFWAEKLITNVERDRRQTSELLDLGWAVLRFWEHEVYNETERVVAAIRRAARGQSPAVEAGWRVVRVDLIDTELDTERRVEARLLRPEVTRVAEGPRVTGSWRRPR